jgi:antitoxin YqcF
MGWIEESGRATARRVTDAFGGTPRVTRHYDEPERHFVDILASDDRPTTGLRSYSTIGLQTVPNLIDDTDIRVELAGVAPMAAMDFANVMGTAAFCVIKDRWRCAPGIVFPSVIKMYQLSSTLEHIVFSEPFQWEELGSVDVAPDKTVHWLLVIPISDSEYRFMLDRGWDALDELFVKREIEYFDLERVPVV